MANNAFNFTALTHENNLEKAREVDAKLSQGKMNSEPGYVAQLLPVNMSYFRDNSVVDFIV